MITYAKGASVLKQLVAWVGLDPFLAGLRQYFKDHEYGNSEFNDLLAALEKSSGRELQALGPGVAADRGRQHARPVVRARRRRRLLVVRGAPDGRTRTSRRCAGTGSASACTTVSEGDGDGRLVRRDYVEIDVEGASTEVAELVGVQQPDLLLLNDEDHAYAKIRLDERSLATAIASLSAFDDSLPRALVWGAAWDMTRDGEMRARDWVDLVLANIGQETDAFGGDPDPGVHRAGDQLLLRPRAPRRAARRRGRRACASCCSPPSPAATTSSPSPGRTPAPPTATPRSATSSACSTGRSRSTDWPSTRTCAGR